YGPGTLTPPNLVSISLSPTNPTVPLDTALRFTATGTFSGGSTEQLVSVTWSSSNTAVASITDDASNLGTSYSAAAGSATVSACMGTICGSTMVTSVAHVVHWPGPIVLPPGPPSLPVPGRPPMPPTVPPPGTSSGTGSEPVVRSPSPIVLPPPPPSLPEPGEPAPPPTVPPTGNLSETGIKDVVRSPGLTVLPLWPPAHQFLLKPLLLL